MSDPEIRVVLTTNSDRYATVEVFVGKKPLCASVSSSPAEAYEKVIRKLAKYGQEVYQENEKFAEFVAASVGTTVENARKVVLR